MSTFNGHEHMANHIGKHFVSSSMMKEEEYCNLDHTQGFVKVTKPNNDSNLSTDSYPCNVQGNDANFFDKSHLRKRYRGSADHGVLSNVTHFDQNQHLNCFSLNGRQLLNFCPVYFDQYSENPYVFMDSNRVQDLTNIPSNTSTFNSNVTYLNNTKTANCSGSSVLVHSQLPRDQSSSASQFQCIYPTDSTNYHDQIQSLKSQHGGFSSNINDLDIETINEGHQNPAMVTYIGDRNLNLMDSYINNNPMLISNGLVQAMSIPVSPSAGLIQPAVLSESNVSQYHERDNNLGNTESIYNANGCMPVLAKESRNRFVLLNNNVAPNTTYTPFNVSQFQPYSNDKMISEKIISNDNKIKLVQNPDGTESFVGLQGEPQMAYYPQVIGEYQQGQQQIVGKADMAQVDGNESLLNEVGGSVNAAQPMSDDSPVVKSMGKFTIKTIKENNKSGSTLVSIASTEHGPLVRETSTEENNKSTNQVPRSRFKKTRIKEPIERWEISGIKAYDSRFKVIPSKIMELKNRNLGHLAHDYQANACVSCGDHDSGYRCHSNEYYNKEFLFWDNGDRISLCEKSDHDTENYCQFHAKFLKLLNQNQNLSLSKYVPQYFNVTNDLLSQSATVIRAVFVSTSDNETYTTSLGNNTSQNIALSAPPASPSQVNSRQMSCFDYNAHSPKSGGAMLMLRCQTPVLRSRNSSKINESISMERISHIPTSRISMEVDNSSMITQDTIMADIANMCPINSLPHDHLAFALPPQSSVDANAYFRDYVPDSATIYNYPSISNSAYIPHMIYSIPQKVNPPTLAYNPARRAVRMSNSDECSPTNPASSAILQDLDEHLKSIKSLFHNLIQSEKQTLIDDVISMRSANESLRKELSLVQRRCEYLESVLKENNVPVEMSVANENNDVEL